MGEAEGYTLAYVQPYQGYGDAGVEDDVGGAGVVVDVEFGVGGDVSADLDRASHDKDLADPAHGVGVSADGEGEVGERAERDDGEVAVRVSHRLGYVLFGGQRVGRGFGVGKRDGHAAGAVVVLAKLELSEEGGVGSEVNGDV